MLNLLADEDFNNDILRGVRRRNADVDLLRVQDTEATGQSDAAVLELAAQLGRVFAHSRRQHAADVRILAS